VILLCVRWYVAYPLSLRHLEEMTAERGLSVDYSYAIHQRRLSSGGLSEDDGVHLQEVDTYARESE